MPLARLAVVNNCGEVQQEPKPAIQVATLEYVPVVMNSIESADLSWDDSDVAK